MSLKDRYRHASLFIQNNNKTTNVKSMEMNRWKLYGFHKQCMDGDCGHPSVGPEHSSSESLKLKWNAWMACKGMSREEAMEGFISLVKEIDNSYEFKENDNSLDNRSKQPDMSDKLTATPKDTNSTSGTNTNPNPYSISIEKKVI